jgi:hypothetical protein
MPLRFTRRLSLIPGLRVNLSKGCGSLSVGHRGASYAVGPRRGRATLGLPGTGLDFPPERRSFQRRVDCNLSKGARYTNIRCHAVPLAAKFRLLQATVGIRLRRKHKGTH